MEQMPLDVFVFLLILTFSSSQRLLYRCDFDTGLSNNCTFDIEVGGPAIVAVYGASATNVPTQPLSDVKSILSLTTPNNELCELPYSIPPGTWPNYFCEQNSAVNYTCPTASGTGNCATGQYGLITTQRAGPVDYRYTMRNAVRNHTNDYQCVDFFYYMTNGLLNAEITVGWSAGLAPFPITTALPQPENKWHQHRYTYPNPREPNYNIWFQILRDGGILGFSFALDEIQVFDGPCESPTTTETTSIGSTADSISITEAYITTAKSLSATEISTVSPTNEQTILLNGTESTTLSSSLLTTTTTTTQPVSTVTHYTVTNTQTSIDLQTTITSTSTSTISNKRPDLSLILGLTLGIGLPMVTLLALTLVYYYKIVVPKRKVFADRSNANEMRIRSSTSVAKNTDTIDAIVI